MTPANDFLDREAAAWAAFEVQVARVPAAERERPGVVEGWSVKDVFWHCAYWTTFAVDVLEQAGDEPFEDPFDAETDEHWDAVNAEVAEASRGMTWEAVSAGTQDARDRLRAHVQAADHIQPAVLTWAEAETFDHYDEHTEHVQAFADALG
jgi:hypothetical protein